ncbi:MAG: O-antigen ligase family protein, partial [Prolixibacteraceae bacterium]|nr:O-antigen ligase family protein [Prolixibacteraceae bacterium]
MISNKSIKITLFYLISVSFILLNMWFVIKKDFLIINLLPLFLGLFLFAVFSFDKIIYFIVFFTPLSLSLSDLVYDLSFNMFLPTEPLLFLVLTLFILKIVHERSFDRDILVHPVSIALYFYLAWMLITCFTSTMIVISLKSWLSRIWFVVVLYLMATKIFSDRKKIEKYIWLYIIPFILVILYSTYRHIGEGLLNKQAAHSVVSPFYNDHTSYGAALAIYLPFLALFAFGPVYSKKMRFVSLIVFTIFLIALVLSYSRAAWVSIIVAVIFWTIIKFKIKLRPIFLSLVIFMMFVFTFQHSIVMYLERNSGESSSNLAEHFSSISNITSDASNLERINRWNCALRMFADKPVFGWGPGTYMFKYAPYQINKDRTV